MHTRRLGGVFWLALLAAAGCGLSPRNTGVLAVRVGDTLYAAYNLRVDVREHAFLSASQPVLRDSITVLARGAALAVDTVFDDNDGAFFELHLVGPPRGKNREGRYYLRLDRVDDQPARELLARFLSDSIPATQVRPRFHAAQRRGRVEPGMNRAEVLATLGCPPPIDGAWQAADARVWSYRRLDAAQNPRSLRKNLLLSLAFDGDILSSLQPADYFAPP